MGLLHALCATTELTIKMSSVSTSRDITPIYLSLSPTVSWRQPTLVNCPLWCVRMISVYFRNIHFLNILYLWITEDPHTVKHCSQIRLITVNYVQQTDIAYDVFMR